MLKKVCLKALNVNGILAPVYRKQAFFGSLFLMMLCLLVLPSSPAYAVQHSVVEVSRMIDEDSSPRAFEMTLHGSDMDGDSVRWSISQPPQHGVASVQAKGSAIKVDYQPEKNWHGVDVFYVELSDNLGGSNKIRITVDVAPINDAPVNRKNPSIIGDAEIGKTIAVGHGEWDDSIDGKVGSFVFSYQWMRASKASVKAMVPIQDAIAQHYQLTEEDQGAYLAVRVTAVDEGGDASGISSASSAAISGLRRVGNQAPLISLVAPDEMFVLKGFIFEGNHSHSTHELNTALGAFVGQTVSLDDLRETANTAMKFYQQRSSTIVHAQIPAQVFDNGMVRMNITEGKLGKTNVSGNSNYSSEFISKYITDIDGDPLRSDDLERALLALNKNAGLQVRSVLDRGSEPGEVDVNLYVDDRRFIAANFEYNNYGSDTISQDRYKLGLDFIGSSGSHFNIQGMTGNYPSQLSFGSLRYEKPIGTNGTRVGFTASSGAYEVSKVFADLGLRGDSISGSIFVSHPFILNRDHTLTAEFGAEMKDARFYLLDVNTSTDHVRTAYISLNSIFSTLDTRNFIGGKVIQGLGGIIGGSYRDYNTSRKGADNQFVTVQLSGSHHHELYYGWSVFGSASGQWSDDSLVSSEEWQIGGVGSVRGYMPGAETGSIGYNTSLEIRYAIQGSVPWVAYSFLDHGLVWRRAPYIAQPKNDDLTGAGFGFALHNNIMGTNGSFTLDVGWPLKRQNAFNPEKKPIFNISASMSY